MAAKMMARVDSIARRGVELAVGVSGKRRSDLSALLGNTSPSPSAHMITERVLVASAAPRRRIRGRRRDGDNGIIPASGRAFGAAALGLYRNRVREGGYGHLNHRNIMIFNRRCHVVIQQNAADPRCLQGPCFQVYQHTQTSRHAFPLSSLRQLVQNALASKRFAWSH